MSKYQFLFFFVGLVAINQVFGQGDSNQSRSFQLEVGYIHLNNGLNDNEYLDLKDVFSPQSNLNGVSLKFSKETSLPFLDINVGTVFLSGDNFLGEYSSGPSGTYASDYKINGGGVFVGISPKWKKKNFGLTSEFALGTFSFKEQTSFYDSTDDPIVDILIEKSSYGIGGLAGVGFYIQVGRFGINPSVNAIYSGGSNTSFLFYGYTIPLTVRLTN